MASGTRYIGARVPEDLAARVEALCAAKTKELSRKYTMSDAIVDALREMLKNESVAPVLKRG